MLQKCSGFHIRINLITNAVLSAFGVRGLLYTRIGIDVRYLRCRFEKTIRAAARINARGVGSSDRAAVRSAGGATAPTRVLAEGRHATPDGHHHAGHQRGTSAPRPGARTRYRQLHVRGRESRRQAPGFARADRRLR